MNNIATHSSQKIALASLIGTTIEYFDNYIYTMAAVLVFNVQFFHSGDPVSDQLLSLSVLALAFFTRPLGAVLFGHFGDRFGRKNTLIASLLLMGFATVAIGLLPTYAEAGILATILLCLCRIGQGLGLGGEWAGAALVATENAPPRQRGWFGIYPQLGAPLGLLLANGAFFTINRVFGEQAFLDWAWRLPFLFSVVMVAIGLYIRLNIQESEVFLKAKSAEPSRSQIPLKQLFTQNRKPFLLGTLIASAGYVLFYILVAFAPIFAKSPVAVSSSGYPTGLGLPANLYTQYLLITSVIFGIAIALSGYLADRIGRKRLMIIATALTIAYGFSLPLFLENGTPTSLFVFLTIGMILIGLSFGPMSVLLPELFATRVRYTGAALSYTCAGILGGSLFTLIAMKINEHYGLLGVGSYLTAYALLSLIALVLSKETKSVDLTQI